MTEALGVAEIGALLLAHADRDHLADAALDFAAEAGMGLDAVDDDDAVGFVGVLVKVDGTSVPGRAQLDDFHRGLDRAAHGLLGDTQSGEHVLLPFGGRAAVTAHRGEDEGRSAACFDLIDKRLDDERIVGDAAAACGDGNAHAGLDSVEELAALQLGEELAGRVGDHGPGEVLTDFDETRDLNGIERLIDKRHSNHSSIGKFVKIRTAFGYYFRTLAYVCPEPNRS